MKAHPTPAQQRLVILCSTLCHSVWAQVYCLPDGYEVVDNSLNDIRQFINPVFSPEAVASLDAGTRSKTALLCRCPFRLLDIDMLG